MRPFYAAGKNNWGNRREPALTVVDIDSLTILYTYAKGAAGWLPSVPDAIIPINVMIVTVDGAAGKFPHLQRGKLK